ncbi:metallo-beta-lactamase domain-containing protein [Aulographum hederae CBS 113979]|uniref:Metallo-beta-lactamase domain-containing protein n=1 Tax=Aulographum hederae CBS 113979 TaxID=1176131 RepID=A0A6G1GMI1_9PEZI|nr:metallo-beta-lactamase domain-containing protein [Aulographum hederae CBS 113979]
MASPFPHLPDIERLSPRVVRVLGGNPSKFTLQGTNTYLVGQGPKRLLIDTGSGYPAWKASLKQALAQEKATIDRCILTHWHPDHVGGVLDLLEICPDTVVYKNQPREGDVNISDGQLFETDGATLKAFHSPGHTTDHMALVLPEEDAIFTGDNVLGHGTAVFEDLATYIDSLSRMSSLVSGRAYPAHGAVIENARSKMLDYIRHRKEREDQVVGILEQKRKEGTEGIASLDIVKMIYPDLGSDMWSPADRGIRLILAKLSGEGKVQHHESENIWAMNGKATL